jgi:hypothetical protein
MADRRSEIRYENGKEAVRAAIAEATVDICGAQEARARAKESLAAFKEQRDADLEQASKRFTLLQRIEFVIGALVLIQIAIFMLKGEPYIMALIYSTVASIALYVVAAIIDSRAKGRKLDIESQLLAAKKVKLKNDGDGVAVEFE